MGHQPHCVLQEPQMWPGDTVWLMPEVKSSCLFLQPGKLRESALFPSHRHICLPRQKMGTQTISSAEKVPPERQTPKNHSQLENNPHPWC